MQCLRSACCVVLVCGYDLCDSQDHELAEMERVEARLTILQLSCGKGPDDATHIDTGCPAAALAGVGHERLHGLPGRTGQPDRAGGREGTATEIGRAMGPGEWREVVAGLAGRAVQEGWAHYDMTMEQSMRMGIELSVLTNISWMFMLTLQLVPCCALLRRRSGAGRQDEGVGTAAGHYGGRAG